ncbi:GNAT family N-acetyltransferase [Bacillus clarus]|uniref:Acetyltransferase family protein n=1 Tax=Bacillus clarus TaxID=2338372 RepID=A0A090Z549_9BACI|nr:GNAT family N-acetyltransferase [Bacillus clarus]KFM99495.1 acetyltransferase family protein [Bacillus clarus]RFT67666.1 GNAT family N-acetyltransferase [Bacillus clarus]
MGNIEKFASFLVEEPKREQLFPLFEEVFGIARQTLQDFVEKGYWDHTYKAFSYLQDENVIANVSKFHLPLIINGEKVHAAGIQSVMTHPNYRRQGLMKQLFSKMLEEIDEEYECTMLFTEKPELYEVFGFEILKEYLMTLSYDQKIHEDSSIRKLDFYNKEDIQLIKEILENSQRLSNMFSTINYQSSFYLNMYDQEWNEKLYYSEKLDAIIVFELNDQKLKLFGVFAPVIPVLDEVCAEISEEFTEIEFYFCPDQLGIEDVQYKEYQSNKYLMVRSNHILNLKKCKFPMLTEF